MKRKILAIVPLLALIVFAYPSASGAEENEASVDKTKFCERISGKLTGIQQKMISWETKIKDKQGNILKSVNAKREIRSNQIGKIRSKWDQNQENHFQKLRERAAGEEQKQAVEQFITAVKDAVKTRNETFDRTVREFQIELDALVVARKASIKQKAEDYKKFVDQAYETAKTACWEGTTAVKIQQNLKSLLNIAKEQYRNQVNPEQNYKDEMEALLKEKRDAVKTATDAFHDTIQKAKESLRVVFKEA